MFPSPLLASGPSQPLEEEEEISSGSESDSEYDDYYFLQPLPIRQRRVLLKTSGVKKIDNDEKEECRDIRVSRNVCGCDCQLYCDPVTCTCSLAGIQCQVDRLSFPCGCTKDGCKNPSGRIEFNPIRVRTHFIHTLMRLELERKDCHGLSLPSDGASPYLTDTNLHVDVVGSGGEGSEEETTCAHNEDTPVACTDPSVENQSLVRLSVDKTEDAELTDPNPSEVKPLKLKGRLKTRTEEPIDLNLFNSNERGSCRDCQNTDVCKVMMNDVKFSIASHQQRQQQQRIISLSQPQPFNGSPQLHAHHLHLPPGAISLLHQPPAACQQQTPPSASHMTPPTQRHMLLFNDGEEDSYPGDNSASMYFDQDDNSYSELSDAGLSRPTPGPSTSPADTRTFSTISCSGPANKFHLNPTQVFSVSTMSGPQQNPPGSRSLLNMSCGLSGASLPGQDSVMRISQPTQSHPTAMLGDQHPAPIGQESPSSSLCPTPNNQIHAPNFADSRQNQQSHLGFEESFSFPDHLGGYHHSFPGREEVNPSNHLIDQKYNPAVPGTMCYPSTPHAGDRTTGYLDNQNHNQTSGLNHYEAPSSIVTNGNADVLLSSQHAPQLSAWSNPLVAPTLSDCFDIETSTTAIPGHSSQNPDFNTAAQFKPGNGSVKQEVDSNNTYATMTTTTRDRLAANCPGISSHMEGQVEVEPNITAPPPSLTSFDVSEDPSVPADVADNSPFPVYASDPDLVSTSVDEPVISADDHLPASDLESADATTTSSVTGSCETEVSQSLFVKSDLFDESLPNVTTELNVNGSDVESSSVNSVTKNVLPESVLSMSDSKDVREETFHSESSANVCDSTSKFGQTNSSAGCGWGEGLDSCLTETPADLAEDFQVKRNVEVASYPSSSTQSSSTSSASSSSSSPTGDEEKEGVDQNFGEIIKESIVEMVLV